MRGPKRPFQAFWKVR